MTKRRPPLTLAAALTRLAGVLGWEEMADTVRRRPGLVRAWADPDRREEIPLRDAIQLDRAWRAAGGEGAPLFEVYAERLDASASFVPAETAALIEHAALAVRECGEANAALLEAARPGAAPAAHAAARREVEQAIRALRHALPLLLGRDAFASLFEDHSHAPRGPPPVGSSRAN